MSNRDFDQFWEEYSEEEGSLVKPEPIRILGKDYFLRVDVELKLVLSLGSADSRDLKAMKVLVDKLYGDNVLFQWIEDGFKLRQLPILLAWSMATIQGMDITFKEVAEQLKGVLSGKEPISLKSIGELLNADSLNATGSLPENSVESEPVNSLSG